MHLGHVCFAFFILIQLSTPFLLHPHKKYKPTTAPTTQEEGASFDDQGTSLAGHPMPVRDQRHHPFYYHNFPHFPSLHETDHKH